MELVAADFLKHMVEITTRRFFRVVRSVRTSSTQESLATPQKCADFLTASFDKVTEVLLDHPLMVKQEAHFRLQSARRNETSAADRTESAKREPSRTEKQTVKFIEVTPETKKSLPQRTCSGHLGSQLGAIKKDGRPYACGFGKDCAFAHVSVGGKSKERLSEMVSTMALNVRSDLTKAIQSRK
jgi:hypothetical protein